MADEMSGMTDEEKFRFDLTGYLVRPAILTSDEVAAMVDQIDRITHDKDSLPPHEQGMPGGAAAVTIDHPKVMEVLHEIIGPDVRLENTFHVWRTKGEQHGELHGGGPGQIDPRGSLVTNCRRPGLILTERRLPPVEAQQYNQQ